MAAQCARCGQANRAGASFCSECGAPLAARCTSCGAELVAGAKFCDTCGAPAAAAAAPVPATAAEPEGGRKTVSVIFTDLAGSTRMQEALDAESVRRVMARYYEVMRATVSGHGGTVEKFIGDAVVAVFGTPLVREDDALRAVRCAAEMASALETLNDELEQAWGVRLRTRTGVNTGELVISPDGILVGDTMNTAARLEQAAPTGAVLIGEATWRLVRHHVAVEEVPPLELKGKSGAVRAWRLVSATGGPAVSDGDDVPDAPLVGRAVELDRLHTALDQVITARGCRLVTVIGSPGLGKSRLASEFARGVGERALVVYGHCEPSGEGNTFLPVVEVIREVAGIGESDRAELVREKLLALAPPDDPDRDRLVERTSALLGIGETASAQETFWALRRGLEALAQERPLVIVLDDLHWAQPMLLDLVEHLVEWITDAPVLIVALARPELRDVREALSAAGRRASDVIELLPLDTGESRALLDGLLGTAELPVGLLGRILETTEGNPLFLGELIRMLIDEGALIRSANGWVLAGGVESVDVPPTIHALLTARIERLRADERAVVERAAVIGKQFYRGAVAELLTPTARSGIDGHLESLRRKEMVEPEGVYWIDEPVYRFHHVLIRDAAYRLLLKEARAVLHERFADWLEEKAGELVGEYEEVIAFHLEQAHLYRRELGPLDDSGRAMGARAATHLESAGRRALAREDLAAAENLLSRALACGSGDPQAVLWDLAEAVLSAGDVAAAAGVIQRFAATVGDEPGGRARAAVIEAQLANLTGDDDPAATARAVTDAAAELAALGDGAGEAKAWSVAAQTNARLGRVGEVESALDRALTAARAADDRRRTTAVLAAAPRAALWGPSSVVRASGRCLDVVRILRMTPGNRHVEALALRCQAVLEGMRGRLDAAREILAGARAVLEELGLTLELHETTVHAGIVELLADDADAAAGHFRSALQGFKLLGADAAAASAAAMLARALVARRGAGDVEDALAQVEFARERGGEDLRTALIAAGAEAEALAQSGRLDEAVSAARRVVSRADPTDALPDKADASMSLARVLLAAGDGDGARVAARAALLSYEAKGHTVGAQRARQLAGSSAAAAPKPPPFVAAPSLGSRAPEAFYARWIEQFAARDIEAMVERCSPAYVLSDRRSTVSQGVVRGIEGYRRLMESVLAMPDGRVEIREVLACDENVIAVKYVVRGHAGKIDGEVEVPVGEVGVVRDGLLTAVEMYDYDDDATMIARYTELGGGLSALGDSPPERWWRELATRSASRRREDVRELWANDWVFVDHRQMGWSDLNGPAGAMTLVEGSWSMSRYIWFEVDEVLACDDRVIALRYTHRGRGIDGDAQWELPLGVVTVHENGQQVRSEQFDHDDADAILARYRELGGTSAILGHRQSEQVLREVQRVLHARDYARLAELLAEDAYIIDHRALGYADARGRRECLRDMRAAFDASPHVRLEFDEVLAADDHVAVTRIAFRGRGVKAGELETTYLAVTRADAGMWVGAEYYELGDRQSAIARYVELGGGLSALGDSPTERLFAQYAQRLHRRDLDGALDLYTSDVEMLDHRTAIAQDHIRGREANRGFMQSMLDASPDLRLDVEEVLAADERVVALRIAVRGHGRDGVGELEVPAGWIGVVEAGRFTRVELHDDRDRAAMLARYGELGGRRAAPLGVRPLEQITAEYARMWAAADLDGLLEMYADDWVMHDRRSLSLWGEMRGREAAREMLRSALSKVRDPRYQVLEVLGSDDRVIASRIRWTGVAGAHNDAPYEVEFGAVSVFCDGRETSVDIFDSDDRAGMLQRFGELTGAAAPEARRPSELVNLQELRRYNAHDLDGYAELYAEDFFLVDHRLNGWGTIEGRDGVRDNARMSSRVTPDTRMERDELIAADDRVLALLIGYRGHAAEDVGGGEVEVIVGYVSVYENGQVRRTDVYDPDDRDAIVARYAGLGGGLSALGDTPMERYYAEYARRFASRDVERLLELVSDDYLLVDHRPLGWEETRGHAGLRSVIESTRETTKDIRIEVDEVLAVDDGVLALRLTWVGHSRVDGGEWVVPVAQVWSVRDERLVRVDQYEPDDREAVIARYAELGGGQSTLGDSSPERVCKEFARRYARRDLDGLFELLADDFTIVDHRQIGWVPMRGRQPFVDLTTSGWESALDIRYEFGEVLAVDDRTIAVTLSYVGHSRDGGGEFSIETGQVCRLDPEGRWIGLDIFDPDDRAGMLARFGELSGGGGPATPRAPELATDEATRRYNAHDAEGWGAMCAETFVLTDHRLNGWGTIKGPNGMRDQAAIAFALSADIQAVKDEVIACDDRVIALRFAWRGHADQEGGGGEFELPVLFVGVVEDGLMLSCDMYEPEDRQSAIARYVELGGGQAPLGDRPPERVLREWMHRFAASEFDVIKQMYASQVVLIDHRRLGYEEAHGPEAAVSWSRTSRAASPELRLEVDEVLACDESVLAAAVSWRGRGVKAGELELPQLWVMAFEDGLMTRLEIYEPENRDEALARFAELT